MSHWNPVLPLLSLVLVAAGGLAILLVLEWNRKQRFKWIRIVCQTMAVLSVLGLVLRPVFSSPAPLRPLAILTAGFDAARVDSLKRVHPNLLVFETPESGEFAGAVKLADFHHLKSLRGNPVWVLGYGLPWYSLDAVPFNFQHIHGGLPDGIEDLDFRGTGTVGRWNTVQGKYLASTAQQRTLRLVGPGGVEDSVIIKKKGVTAFSLNYFPKVAGNMVFVLEEKDSAGQTSNSQHLPASIEEARKLDIIFIADYPSFEQRYLKNFLSSKGHRLAVRNRVSKERYHQEFANRAPLSLSSLTPALLDETDVLMIDQVSFGSASDPEKRAIRNAMKKGLGVLVLAGEKSRGQQLVNFEPVTAGSDTVRFSIGGAETLTLSAAAIKPGGDVTPWLVSTEGRILTGCLCTGSSSTGFQLLRETFQLGLEGKSSAYASIWTPLLERIARKMPAEFDISVRTQFPWYSNEPIDFDVISGGAAPSLRFDDMLMPLGEDINVDALWHGRVWADGNKWHLAAFDDSDVSFGIYDLPTNEWNTLRLARQVRANSQHAVAQGREDEAATPPYDDGPLPIALLLLFVLSSGFLWLAPKI